MILPMSRKLDSRLSGADDPALEARRVRRWRRQQFHELGFTLSEAYVLADAPVDLGDARRLIGAGCPKPTALRVLL
jgi:hypothetical protein